jgi:hypothetical protein
MAIRPLNSVAGFSVGETPANIILANGDITTTNITLTGVSNLNSISNVKVSGGTVGQVISTDGSGNLSFITVSTAGLSNGTSNINVLNSGNITFSVAGNANVGVFTDTGLNVAGTLNATGNANVENIGATNGVFTNVSGNGSALSSITGANVTGTVANATHASTANTVVDAAQGNITSVGTLTGLDVNGNIVAVNITANTGVFTGNANGLNNIPGANVTGTVANATFATSAGSATTAVTVTASAQSNITSVGTLTGLSVDGSNITLANGVYVGNGSGLSAIAGANVTGEVGFAAVANSVAGANVSGAVAFATTANSVAGANVSGEVGFAAVANSVAGANVSGQVANALVAGTVYTNSQPNITSVGILTSLDVTGNIDASANINVDTVAGKTGSINIVATGANNNVFLKPTGTGSVDVWSKIISNVATPVASTDAATKGYVDSVAEGLHVHASSAAATDDTLANISSGTVTYDNGTAGVGATLTTNGTYTTIDGVNIATVGTRILVKDEANAAHNGIYVYTSSTVLTRADDYDTAAEVQAGDFTFVSGGTLYEATGWVQINEVTTIGTDPIEWQQFSGAGTFLAGTGLTLTGDTFSISNTTVTAASYGSGDAVATFTVNSQGQLTAAANVAIAANAANLTGSTLSSNITTSSLTSVGTLGSLTVTGNVAAGNLSTGGTLSVSGNANVGNLGTAQILATANVTAPQLISNVSTGTAPFVVTSTTQVANLNAATAGSATTAGTVTTNAQPNITSVGTLTSLAVTGNTTTGNISATNGNLTTANVSGSVILGNSSVTTSISYGSVTTTSITANQTIASFSSTGVTGVEFLVKSIDSTGSKYGVATVVAVTDGTAVDFSTFATVNLGGYTGALAVNIEGGFIRLQVTPASSNSTVWTTQLRLI